MDQVPPPLVICIYYTWYTNGSHGPVCFSHPGAGSGGKNVTLNSAFVSVEYNQRLQLYFGEQVRVLKILINNPTKMMCSCSLKTKLGKTEESYLGGKTHICAR